MLICIIVPCIPDKTLWWVTASPTTWWLQQVRSLRGSVSVRNCWAAYPRPRLQKTFQKPWRKSCRWPAWHPATLSEPHCRGRPAPGEAAGSPPGLWPAHTPSLASLVATCDHCGHHFIHGTRFHATKPPPTPPAAAAALFIIFPSVEPPHTSLLVCFCTSTHSLAVFLRQGKTAQRHVPYWLSFPEAAQQEQFP